jgi:hypothetical protein
VAETETKNDSIQVDFSDIVKKAYDKGLKETGMTVEKLIEDLKADLKHLVVS